MGDNVADGGNVSDSSYPLVEHHKEEKSLILPLSDPSATHPDSRPEPRAPQDQLPHLVRRNTSIGPWRAAIAALSRTETSGQTYGFGPKDAESRYRRLGREAMSTVIGPMPPDLFLRTFLRSDEISKDRMPLVDQAFEAVPESGSKESEIYEPLIDALNGKYIGSDGNVLFSPRCPDFRFCNTSSHADTSGPGKKLGSMKPDICLYANDHLQHVTVDPKRSKRKKKVEDTDVSTSLKDAGDAGMPTSVQLTDMSYVALFFEIKKSKSLDFFIDPPPGADRSEWRFVLHDRNINSEAYRTGLLNLGQNVSYAIETCKRQYRECVYSVSMSGSWARLIRWDRAGAIVSDSFNIRKDPKILCEFFWCFSALSDAGRGYDLTVQPAAPEDELLFYNAIEEHVRTQAHTDDIDALEKLVQEHYEKGAVTMIFLPTSESTTTTPTAERLLVSRPVSIPLSLAGRGTRTYWAVRKDATPHQVVLLKDTWSYDIPGGDDGPQLKREGDVLEHLNAMGVRNVPHVVYHQDVPRIDVFHEPKLTPSGIVYGSYGEYQTTLTQSFLNESWVCRGSRRRISVTKRTHYRLVLHIAGYTLMRLRGSRELLSGAYDAFIAMKDAFEKAGRLHRDVTPGNIILFDSSAANGMRERTGYLVDWDLSRATSLAQPFREMYEVSATWQFLSRAICASSRSYYETAADHIFLTARQQALVSNYRVTQHTIQDDMESIFYVVLYCALFWTAHSIHDITFRNVVMQLFDAHDDSPIHIIPQGGDGKSQNMDTRASTFTLRWDNPAIDDWLDIVMDFIRPIPGSTPLDRYDCWNPIKLDEFWGGFLRDRTDIPTTDRTDNFARYKSQFEGNVAPQVSLGQPNQGTRASSGPPRPLKRRADTPCSGLSGAPFPKRPRMSTTSLADSVGDMPWGAGTDSGGTGPAPSTYASGVSSEAALGYYPTEDRSPEFLTGPYRGSVSSTLVTDGAASSSLTQWLTTVRMEGGSYENEHDPEDADPEEHYLT